MLLYGPISLLQIVVLVHGQVLQGDESSNSVVIIGEVAGVLDLFKGRSDLALSLVHHALELFNLLGKNLDQSLLVGVLLSHLGELVIHSIDCLFKIHLTAL